MVESSVDKPPERNLSELESMVYDLPEDNRVIGRARNQVGILPQGYVLRQGGDEVASSDEKVAYEIEISGKGYEFTFGNGLSKTTHLMEKPGFMVANRARFQDSNSLYTYSRFKENGGLYEKPEVKTGPELHIDNYHVVLDEDTVRQGREIALQNTLEKAIHIGGLTGISSFMTGSFISLHTQSPTHFVATTFMAAAASLVGAAYGFRQSDAPKIRASDRPVFGGNYVAPQTESNE